jgi:hypothetical protein
VSFYDDPRSDDPVGPEEPSETIIVKGRKPIDPGSKASMSEAVKEQGTSMLKIAGELDVQAGLADSSGHTDAAIQIRALANEYRALALKFQGLAWEVQLDPARFDYGMNPAIPLVPTQNPNNPLLDFMELVVAYVPGWIECNEKAWGARIAGREDLILRFETARAWYASQIEEALDEFWRIAPMWLPI